MGSSAAASPSASSGSPPVSASSSSAAEASTSTSSSSSSSSSSVRVGALSFCRLECDHGELFLNEYKRSNRTKGLKILRCFPHCCPNHIDRSYCGTSLHVVVQTEPGAASSSASANTSAASSAAVARAKQLADSVFLFARFECSTDAGLRMGETLPSSAVVRDTQSEENPEGQWIPGIKERASTLSSAMKSVAQSINDHTLVYQLNGKVYSRWYYDWESGANKAQRLMRHVLKAYVFERCASEDRQSPYALRVIGIVSSPEFTVISYRRAPNEGGALGAPAPVGKGDATPREPSPSSGMGGDRGSSRSTPDLLVGPDGHKRSHRDGMRHSVSSLPADDPMDGESKRRRRSGAQGSAYGLAIPLRDATPLQLFEDRVLWEHANASVVTVSKNLALLFHFLQWTPLDYYAGFVDELVHLVNHKILEPLVNAPEKLNCFARVLLEHAQTQPTSRHRGVPPVLSHELEMLLRAMAQAAMWFFSEEMRWWTREFVQRHASSVTSKPRLRAAFVLWNVELEARLNRHVFSQSPLQTLANAAEEIIAAVYTHELYHPKRPVVRQVLGEHGFLGWRSFVAQMRDSFIAQSSTRSRRSAPTASAATATTGSSVGVSASEPAPLPRVPLPSNLLERMWNGDWVLDVDESSWKSQDGLVHADGISLVAVMDLMTQLSRLQVMLQLEQRVLSLRSRAAFATAANFEGMKLVLDGKSRVFRFSPHGVSTAMSEGADGDYIGSTRVESPDRLIVYLETFRWSRTPGTRSYHVRMRIECFKQQRLFVNGEVLETISASCFPNEELQFMPERKIAAKMKIVNRLFARQPMAVPLPLANASASASAGLGAGTPPANVAWRRLGGFRLVYARATR